MSAARRASVCAAVVLLLIMLSAAVGAWIWERQMDARIAAPSSRETARLHIDPGDNLTLVARRLETMGWLRSSWALRLHGRIDGWDRSLTPGFYLYHRGETVRGLIDRLRTGAIGRFRLTVVEGRRVDPVLSALADSAWIPLEDLHAAAQDDAWLASLEVPGPGLEGYLLPETYWLPRGLAARHLLEPMIRSGLVFWRDSLEVEAEELGLSRRELWTLASIIEAEAVLERERTLISAVFWNRLRRGMRLEADPTVLFALGREPGRLLYSDLNVDSPYNTYRNTGLPPGPICCPGRASLLAAIRPAPGFDAIFFVARGDGSHVFSRTLTEHNRARQEVRRAANRPG